MKKNAIIGTDEHAKDYAVAIRMVKQVFKKDSEECVIALKK